MKLTKLPIRKKEIILALGAESVGVFAVYCSGDVFVSENFGDLLDENNFLKYKKAIFDYLKKEKTKPNLILSDLHPLYKTTILGTELALRLNSGQAHKKNKTRHIKVQHHIAHIFSAVGDKIILNTKYLIPNTFFGLAMDGTGYGLDGNIWGGEVFKMTNDKFPMTIRQLADQNPKSKTKSKKNNFNIERIGSLEEQIMIGGDLAVMEPARILVAILAKIPNSKSQRPTKSQILNLKQNLNSKSCKDFIYKFVKKFYTRNELEALYSQMEQDFNCQKTTSTGRVLDAVAVLLGFAGNDRNFKHEATKKLEENSTIPYFLDSKIPFSVIASPVLGAWQSHFSYVDCFVASAPRNDKRWILDTTYLFEYLLKNIKRDKKRLAATAQHYLAQGLYEIIKQNHDSKFMIHNSCFAAGGLSNNKIISEYLEKQGVYLSKKIPRGDEGIAFGQIIYYLTNSRH